MRLAAPCFGLMLFACAPNPSVRMPSLPPEISLLAALIYDSGGHFLTGSSISKSPDLLLQEADASADRVQLVGWSEEDLDGLDPIGLGSLRLASDTDPLLPEPRAVLSGPLGGDLQAVSAAPVLSATGMDGCQSLGPDWVLVASCARSVCSAEAIQSGCRIQADLEPCELGGLSLQITRDRRVTRSAGSGKLSSCVSSHRSPGFGAECTFDEARCFVEMLPTPTVAVKITSAAIERRGTVLAGDEFLHGAVVTQDGLLVAASDVPTQPARGCADATPSQLVRIDRELRVVSTSSAGPCVSALAARGDDVAALFGPLSSAPGRLELSSIDATGTIRRSVPIQYDEPARRHFLVATERQFVVGLMGDGPSLGKYDVRLFDTASLSEVARATLEGEPLDMVSDGERIVVANNGLSRVDVLDARTLSIVETHEMRAGLGAPMVSAVLLGREGEILTALGREGVIRVHSADGQTHRIPQIEPDAQPRDLASWASGSFVAVSHLSAPGDARPESFLTFVDLATLRSLPGRIGPFGVGVPYLVADPEASGVWVLDGVEPRVYLVTGDGR
ncbi:MAG: hypothetical protein HY791_24380 [Deltaproteobacteria bacterium]|nr:hypothetical protein [Deltaproteobacteria bacterium]